MSLPPQYEVVMLLGDQDNPDRRLLLQDREVFEPKGDAAARARRAYKKRRVASFELRVEQEIIEQVAAKDAKTHSPALSLRERIARRRELVKMFDRTAARL